MNHTLNTMYTFFILYVNILSLLLLLQVYSIFGFLSAAGVILVLTCAEIAIVMCYFQLCAEDYCWWWRSLQWAGSCSFYLFLYSIFYQVMQLQISTVLGHFIYFCYCTLIAVSFGLATSATGYFSCYYFIRTIMASIKVRELGREICCFNVEEFVSLCIILNRIS